MNVGQFGQVSYPVVLTFRDFVGRYRYLMQPNLPLVTPATSRQAAIDLCMQLLRAFQVPDDGYILGSSRIFLR